MRKIVIASAAAFALVACAKETPKVDTTAAMAPAAPAAPTGPVVTIISPLEGDTVGKDVTITLGHENVQIAKADSKKTDGVGHYHLFLDTADVADGTVIPPTSTKVIHIGSGDSSFVLKGLAPGAHTVIAVIGYGDHSAMPEKRDTVHFVVK